MKEYLARKVTGWLSNSRCIASELEKIHCENQTQPKHHCQDELVLAILKGLRTQLQVDGKMKVCSVGARFTEHDDEPIDEEDIARIHDDVTGNLLPGHMVRAARQEKIKFLKTFQCTRKFQRRTQKVRNASRSVGACCGTNLGGKIRLSRARSRPLHPWKASVMSFIGFRLVDDDMGGNWT